MSREEWLDHLFFWFGAAGFLVLFVGLVVAWAASDVRYLVGVSFPGGVAWYLAIQRLLYS